MKIRKPKLKLGSKSTWLLCGLSAFGVIATAVASAKATPRAIDKIRSDSRKNHDGDPDAYTKKEALVSGWRFYICPTVLGTVTIACIFGTNALNRKQQAALLSSYAALNGSFVAYKNKVKDIYGQEGHNKVVDEIMKDAEKADPPYIYTPGFRGPETLDFGSELDETPHLFYLTNVDRYFESTISNVIKAEYHLNHNYIMGGMVTINDFLEFLGLVVEPDGDNNGWDFESGLVWLDFNHHITHLTDGLEVYVIECVWSPTPLSSYL